MSQRGSLLPEVRVLLGAPMGEQPEFWGLALMVAAEMVGVKSKGAPRRGEGRGSGLGWGRGDEGEV